MTQRVTGRSLCLALAAVLLGAAAANLAAVPQLQEDQSAISPVLRSDSPDPRQIGLGFSPTMRRRDGMYAQLGLAAQDASIFVGQGADLDLRRLRGLARVHTRLVGYDATGFAADLDVTEHVVADDQGGRLGPVPFTIALLGPDPDALVVRIAGERVDFIDIRLIPGDKRAEILS